MPDDIEKPFRRIINNLDCETLKARLRLLEKYAKNLILDDPEGNYEIGWNAAVRDILSEIEYWKDGLQEETIRVPQRSIR